MMIQRDSDSQRGVQAEMNQPLPVGGGPSRHPLIVIFIPNRPFFGATLVFVPSLLHLREQYPQARLVVLANHGAGQLYKKWGLADDVLRYDRKGGDPWGVFGQSLDWRPDVVINCRPRSTRIHAWTMLIPTPRRLCFTHGLGKVLDRQGRKWDTSRYKALTYLGLVGAGWHNHQGDLLRNWSFIGDKVTNSGGLTIVPSGSSVEKKWPLASYRQLAERWRFEMGTGVQVLVGPDDPEIREWAATVPWIEVVTGGFQAEARALHSAAAVVGNDCGPNHVAQLMDRPRVVIFPSWGNPAEWFRPSPHAEMHMPAKGGVIADVSVDEVWASLKNVCAVNLSPLIE